MDTEFFLKYGLGGVIAAVVVVVITGLLKSPLKKAMVSKAEEKGVDKEIFTLWLAFIPIILSVVGAMVNVSFVNGWANPFLGGFDWKATLIEAIAIWGVSVAFYENGSLFLKAFGGVKSNSSSSSSSSSATVTVASEATTSTTESKAVTKAKATVEKLSNKLVAAQDKLVAKQTEEKEKTAAKLEAEAEAKRVALEKAAAKEAAKLKAEEEAKAAELEAKKSQLETLEKQRIELLKAINGNDGKVIN